MPTQVLVPRLGESVEEVTITRWLKKEGEPVQELEALLEVNTDKVDTEIPSPASGTVLKILLPDGSLASVGTVIAWIGVVGEVIPQGGTTPPIQTVIGTSSQQPAQQASIPAVPPRNLGFISPVVSRIASEMNVDLHNVPGSGQGGRITKKDLLDYVAHLDKTSPSLIPVDTSPGQRSTPAPPPSIPGELIPLTAIRRSIAEHMVLSKHTSAHVTTVMEVDLSRVVSHRQANKDIFARQGVNLTFTAYFAAASVAALKSYPLVNSSFTPDGILVHKELNLGIAASLGEAGLIVPVLKNADSLSLLGLARAVNDLANRAKTRQLKPDEVKGGTFTITNHGTGNSLFATPIINQPQCAILGVGAIQKRVVVIQDASGSDLIAIRPMAYLTLTFDHRILDGASADWFLAKVVEVLSDWHD